MRILLVLFILTATVVEYNDCISCYSCTSTHQPDCLNTVNLQKKYPLQQFLKVCRQPNFYDTPPLRIRVIPTNATVPTTVDPNRRVALPGQPGYRNVTTQATTTSTTKAPPILYNISCLELRLTSVPKKDKYELEKLPSNFAIRGCVWDDKGFCDKLKETYERLDIVVKRCLICRTSYCNAAVWNRIHPAFYFLMTYMIYYMLPIK